MCYKLTQGVTPSISIPTEWGKQKPNGKKEKSFLDENRQDKSCSFLRSVEMEAWKERVGKKWREGREKGLIMKDSGQNFLRRSAAKQRVLPHVRPAETQGVQANMSHPKHI